MLPAADAVAGARWTRGVALVLLALSVLSASYPTWNPWTHPWLYNFFNSSDGYRRDMALLQTRSSAAAKRSGSSY